jgi:glutamine amidotransferase
MKKISIVDYGLGNLFSVKQALEFCNESKEKNVVITSSPSIIKDSDYLVLPGVGAFENAMDAIISRDLKDPIKNFASSGKPLLGICLGMQILATSSEEFGNHNGLNLIPGKVSHIGETNSDDSPRKVPSIGWKNINVKQNNNASYNALSLHEAQSVYFVHSFHFIPEDEKHLIASYYYGDAEITAAVQKDNIIGYQFHPEKSSQNGLKILESFLHI